MKNKILNLKLLVIVSVGLLLVAPSVLALNTAAMRGPGFGGRGIGGFGRGFGDSRFAFRSNVIGIGGGYGGLGGYGAVAPMGVGAIAPAAATCGATDGCTCTCAQTTCADVPEVYYDYVPRANVAHRTECDRNIFSFDADLGSLGAATTGSMPAGAYDDAD